MAKLNNHEVFSALRSDQGGPEEGRYSNLSDRDMLVRYDRMQQILSGDDEFRLGDYEHGNYFTGEIKNCNFRIKMLIGAEIAQHLGISYVDIDNRADYLTLLEIRTKFLSLDPIQDCNRAGIFISYKDNDHFQASDLAEGEVFGFTLKISEIQQKLNERLRTLHDIYECGGQKESVYVFAPFDYSVMCAYIYETLYPGNKFEYRVNIREVIKKYLNILNNAEKKAIDQGMHEIGDKYRNPKASYKIKVFDISIEEDMDLDKEVRQIFEEILGYKINI